MMPVADEDYAMSAVLQPTSTEQVQEIVRICNEFRVPVWPTSTERAGRGRRRSMPRCWR